jgi:hypothetical protein
MSLSIDCDQCHTRNSPKNTTCSKCGSRFSKASEFRGHHTYLGRAFVEPFGPGFWPQMPSPSLKKVDAPGIAPMSLTDCAAQSAFRAGDNDQMHMIRHKAIRPYLHAATAAPLSHEFDVCLVIIITKERPLPTISSLRNMVWRSRSYFAC